MPASPATVVIVVSSDQTLLANIFDLVSGKTDAVLAGLTAQTSADATEAAAILAKANPPK